MGFKDADFRNSQNVRLKVLVKLLVISPVPNRPADCGQSSPDLQSNRASRAERRLGHIPANQARANVACDSPRLSAVPRSRRARRQNSGVDQDRAWLANSSRQTKERAVGMDSLGRSRSICMLAIDRTYARLDRDLTGNLWTAAPWE